MMETIVNIYELAGTGSRAYPTSPDYTDVRAWILPASNETVAFYENAPQGQLFQYKIIGGDISSIAQQAKFIVVDSQISGFNENDEFITFGDAKLANIGGITYITGVCYRKR